MDYCELSEDIIFSEILTRVHAKDLVRFKTVCKLWYNKITDSNFVDAHLHRSNCRSQRQIILTATDEFTCFWQYMTLDLDIDGKNMMTNNVAKFNVIIPGKNHDFKMLLAACDGLLLFLCNYYQLYVCNLVTRQTTALPCPYDPVNMYRCCMSNSRWIFFYDTYVGRYKLFALVVNQDVLMLTSGDKEWKKLVFPRPNIPNPSTNYMDLTTPVFADKELHWLASTSNYVNSKRVTEEFMIYSFDVKSSEFRKTKLRPTLNAEDYKMFVSSKNEESLWFTAVYPNNLVVWGLSGRANIGMTKKFSVSLQKLSYIPEFWYKMFIVEDGGNSNDISDTKLKLFIQHGHELLYHDLKSRVLRQIGNTNIQFLRTYHFHVDSLISWHPADEYKKRKIDDEQ